MYTGSAAACILSKQETILPAGQTSTDSMATAACILSKQHN